MNTEKKRQLKGSVLFTVVCVMSLLVIFLMSTLVLAASANNRAHKSYSSSQTQYTARTAVDSILAAVGDTTTEGQAFAAAVSSLTSGGSFTVDVNINDASMGSIDKAVVAYAGTKQIYDYSKQEWVTKDLISITADVTLGSETTTLTSYVLKDPAVSSAERPGFMTMGNAGTTNQTSSLGGQYFGVGDNWMTKQYIETPPIGDPVTLTDKKYLTNKDYTAGNGSLMEAPFTVDGNYSSNVNIKILVPIKGMGVTIWGNLTFQNGGFDFYSVNLTNSDSYSFNQIPFLYVDGELSYSSNFRLGDGSFPLNVFVGSINAPTNTFDMHADVYCMDADKTTYLSANSNKLYSWAASVVSGGVNYNKFGGNFFSKGSLATNNSTSFEGDVRAEGDVTINGNTIITGDLVVGGKLTINGSLTVNGNIYATTVTGNNVTAGAKTLKTEYTEEDVDVPLIHVTNAVIEHEYWNESNAECWIKASALTDPNLTITMTDSNADGIADAAYNCNGGIIKSEKTGTLYTDYYYSGINWDESAVFDKTYSQHVYKDATGNIVAYTDNYTDATPIYKDATGTVIDASVLYNLADMYYGSKPVVDPSVYKTLKSQEIYPAYAEKAILLGLEELSDGAGGTIDKSQTQLLKTIYDLMSNWNFEGTSVKEIPSSVDVTTNVYNSEATIPKNADGEAEITSSCTLSGSISGNNLKDSTIYVTPPDNGSIWIKLSNTTFMNGVKIIVDDTSANHGTVNFFVEGNVSFNGNGSRIITEKYKELFDSNTPFQINIYDGLKVTGVTEAPIPNIYIYSGNTGASFTIGNMFLMTAYMQAPFMEFSGGDFGEITNDIYYDGANIRNYVSTFRGNIGCVNAKAGSFSNDWTNLYIADSASTVIVQDGLGQHTYASVDYTAY